MRIQGMFHGSEHEIHGDYRWEKLNNPTVYIVGASTTGLESSFITYEPSKNTISISGEKGKIIFDCLNWDEATYFVDKFLMGSQFSIFPIHDKDFEG